MNNTSFISFIHSDMAIHIHDRQALPRIYAEVTPGLPAAVNDKDKVLTRFIVNCKLMARCLLFLHFAN